MDNIRIFSTILSKEQNARSYKNQCTVCLNKQTTQCTLRWASDISSMTAQQIQLLMLLQCAEPNCVGCAHMCM